MSKTAMKMALEALGEIEWSNNSQWQSDRAKVAITALREALAEHCVCGEPNTPGTHRTDGPCLAEQPAQQWQSTADKCELQKVPANGSLLPVQQEPVAWGVEWGRAGDIPCVSIIKRMPGGGIEVVAVEYAPYSYTSPPQRTWVGLSDEDLANCTTEEYETARYWEAKIKEKNNA